MIKQKPPAAAKAMLEQAAPKTRARVARPSAAKARRVRRRAIDAVAERAESEGADPEQALVWKVRALFQPSRLPRALRSAAPATSPKDTSVQLRRVVFELKEQYPTLSAKAKAEISKYIRLRKRGKIYEVDYPGVER
jgi:hypothetical protein